MMISSDYERSRAIGQRIGRVELFGVGMGLVAYDAGALTAIGLFLLLALVNGMADESWLAFADALRRSSKAVAQDMKPPAS